MRATVSALVRKDLLLELRARESVPAMCLFSLTTFILFHFGLNRSSLEGDLAAGVLWVTLLFAAILGVNRLFVAEREQGGFDGFLLAPVDRSAMFLAKAAALLSYLAIVELVAVPAFVLLLLGPAPGAGTIATLIGVIALVDLGVAAIGTLASALAIQTRARDLIVPLVALPLLVPATIAATRATAPLLAAHAQGPAGKWLVVLALYDAVFALLAYALFDFLLED
ncbi:MAG TPA: heme exporter protein CcmB [Solirubrobacteraceae bacterium]|nr:heme exporter protein CcmB [Solirubrobacteraceae bacterium]